MTRARRRTLRRLFALVGTSFAGWLATDAFAEDGRVEINQACAVAAGCFPGDAAGFPVTIVAGAGEAFVLTGDLNVADADTDAITIAVDGVSLDLNGFSIQGPTTCTGAGSTLACDPGVGRGVTVVSVEGTTLGNGTVSGFADSGVVLGNSSRVSGLTVHGNGFCGLKVGINSVVREVMASGNRFDGIHVGSGSTVSSSTSRGNRFHGFLVGNDASVVGNVAALNGEDGIRCGDGNLLRGNAVTRNEDDGIDCERGNQISETAALQNDGDGIEATRYSSARANAIYDSGGFGILFLQNGNNYSDNVLVGNGSGTVSGGVDAGANYP